MPAFLDLTGRTYGRLTVLHEGTRSGKHRRWVCSCACGAETAVFGTGLQQGTTVSCGCWAREKPALLKKPRDIESLMAFVEFDTNGGCWLWSGARTSSGYGVFSEGRSVQTYAHRAFCEAVHGPLGADTHVLHSCDNPSCVNPAHLWPGSRAANMADMCAKQRQALGERNAHARLVEQDVRQIRRDRRSGAALATHYQVSPSTISRVRRRAGWRHVD
jgi:hypothetical protein